jgi:hypothetical protein
MVDLPSLGAWACRYVLQQGAWHTSLADFRHPRWQPRHAQLAHFLCGAVRSFAVCATLEPEPDGAHLHLDSQANLLLETTRGTVPMFDALVRSLRTVVCGMGAGRQGADLFHARAHMNRCVYAHVCPCVSTHVCSCVCSVHMLAYTHTYLLMLWCDPMFLCTCVLA